MMRAEPDGRLSAPSRQAPSADEVERLITKRIADTPQPAAIDLLVVVDETDQIAARRGDPGIQRKRLAGSRFEEVSESAAELRRAAPHEFAGAVAAIVVNNGDADDEMGRRVGGENAVEGAREEIP